MEPVELIIDAVWLGHHAIKAAEDAIKTVTDACENLIKTVIKVSEHLLRDLGEALKKIAEEAKKVVEIVGGALVAAFSAVAIAGVEMHTSVNRASMALTQITGSAAQAASIIRDLKDESLTSALTFKELIPLGQQLAAVYAQIYGSAGVSQRVRPALRAFGDVSTALGVDPDAQRRALQGFQHLVSEDKPSERYIRELEINLPGAGVQGILRKAFGSADTETLQAAKVTGAMVGEAIIAGFQHSFGGFQKLLASSDIGIILSNFQDAFNNLAEDITSRFSPQLSAALAHVLDVVQALSTNEHLISALAVPFDLLGQAIMAAADQLPAFVGWIEKLVTRENVVDLIASIAAGFQTFGDEVMKFLEAVSGGRSFETIWEAFADAGGKALDFVYKSWNVLVAAIKFFSENSGEIFSVIGDALEPIGRWIEVAIQKVEILIRKSQQGIGQFLGGAKSGFGGGASPSGGGSQAGMGGGSEAGFLDGKTWDLIRPFLGPVALQPGPVGDAARNIIGRVIGVNIAQATAAVGANAGNMNPGGPAFPNVRAELTAHSDKHGNMVQYSTAERAQMLFQRGQAAVQAAAGTSLGDLGVTFQGHRAADRAGIGGFLASGQVPGGPQAPEGTGTPPQGPAAPTQKEIQQAIAARNAYFDAMISRAHSLSEMIGGGGAGGGSGSGGSLDRASRAVDAAVLEAKQILPILQVKQQDIVSQLKLLSPQSEEYWKLVREQYHLQDEMQRITLKGVNAQRGMDKALQEEGVKTMDAQADLAKAQIESNPAFIANAAARMKAVIDRLIPIQIAKFQNLVNTQIEGEDESAIFRRLQQAESLRGEINKELGVGNKNVLHTLGSDPAATLPAQRALNRFGRFMSPRDRRGLMEMIRHSGGGVMGLWNEGRVRGVNKQLDDIMSGSVSHDRLHSPGAIYNGMGGGSAVPWHHPRREDYQDASDLGIGGDLNPSIHDTSMGRYAVGGGYINTRAAARPTDWTGGHSVVFAPKVNAAPTPEQLRSTLMQMVDEVIRMAYPGTSGF